MCIGFGVRSQTVGWSDFVLCVGLCASGAETVPSRAGTPCVWGPAWAACSIQGRPLQSKN